MADNRVFWRLALALAVAAIPGGAAFAGPITFTWDPSKATPALAAGPAAFSADTMTLTNYLRITNVNNLTTLRQTFSGTHIQTIDGFTLGGASVAAPGLNSSYGLYFRINLAGSFPINASGAVIGPSVILFWTCNSSPTSVTMTAASWTTRPASASAMRRG